MPAPITSLVTDRDLAVVEKPFRQKGWVERTLSCHVEVAPIITIHADVTDLLESAWDYHPNIRSDNGGGWKTSLPNGC